MKEFTEILIGSATVPQFIGALLFAYLTAFAMLLYKTTKRDPGSPRTPFYFKWSFFFSDNARRIYSNIIFIFLGVRFSQMLIGAENTAYAGLVIGLASDGLAKIFENLTVKK